MFLVYCGLWLGCVLVLQAVDAVGEILLSLSYLPTAERLTVVVAKAKNLVWTNGKTTAGQHIFHSHFTFRTSSCPAFHHSSSPRWVPDRSVCEGVPPPRRQEDQQEEDLHKERWYKPYLQRGYDLLCACRRASGNISRLKHTGKCYVYVLVRQQTSETGAVLFQGRCKQRIILPPQQPRFYLLQMKVIMWYQYYWHFTSIHIWDLYTR